MSDLIDSEKVRLGGRMARSRHRRPEGSWEPAGLPSWAQRHLDESDSAAHAADSAVVTTRRRPSGRRGTDTRLRGWGLAVVSVAAAVTAVPVAITAVANDRSDDPLPTVDTFTAGAPGPLQGGQGTATTRRGAAQESGGEATAGVLDAPGSAPAPVVVRAPRPAAAVRPTTPATPRVATPPTTRSTTTSSGGGRSALAPTSTTPPAGSSSGAGSSSSGSSSSPGASSSEGSSSSERRTVPDDGGSRSPGLVGGTVGTLGKVVGGLL